MVHADASNFPENVTKEEAYKQVLEQAEALMEGQRNWVCNLANASSLLWHAYHSLPSPSNSVNWAGFYVLHPTIPNVLILGPFQGKVACQTIALGRGVCGTAAREGRSVLVDDVDAFEGHITCDGETGSEIVVPVFRGGNGRDGERGEVVGVIDVDCKKRGGFGEMDRMWLEKIAEVLGRGCDW